MAASSAEVKYAVNGTYGSTAYDLSSLPEYAFPQGEAEYEIPQRKVRDRSEEWERANQHEEAIEQAKKAQSISVAAVAGFIVVSILMVLMLLSYVRIAEISGNINTLESTLSEKQEEQTRLQVEYESVFNLTEVKAYATQVLGMTKLTDANTTVVSVEREDKAEILSNDSITGNGFLAAAKEFVSSLLEYFN
jgi:cell division protein FtsL